MFSVWELSLPRPWSRYYGAHLRPQATEASRYRRLRRPRAAPSAQSDRHCPPPSSWSGARPPCVRSSAGSGPRLRLVSAPRRPRRWPTSSCASSGCHRASSPATGRSRTNSTRARPWPGWPARPSARPAARARTGPAACLPRLAAGRPAVRRPVSGDGAEPRRAAVEPSHPAGPAARFRPYRAPPRLWRGLLRHGAAGSARAQPGAVRDRRGVRCPGSRGGAHRATRSDAGRGGDGAARALCTALASALESGQA